VSLVRTVARYVQLRRFERRYSCRVHAGGDILANNRHQRDSIAVGVGTHIRGQLLTFGHGGRITMGSHCYVGDNSKLWSGVRLSIGDRVLIAHNSSIFDCDTHPMNARERHRQYVEIITRGHPAEINLGEDPVTIEDDVWIGCNVVVLKGVTIGRGAVIGAGSIVTDDVPPYVLAAGNPARVVRALTEDERK
jgi:acetyltransferase-like isoleucine patch superfamily enzyme